jgi:hypothetical protein
MKNMSINMKSVYITQFIINLQRKFNGESDKNEKQK